MAERRLTIADFLTDGILAKLFDAASTIGHSRVTLHDLDGRRIAPTDDTDPARRWVIEPIDDLANEIAGALHDADGTVPAIEISRGTLHVLRVHGHPSGGVVLHHDNDPHRDEVSNFVGLLTEKVSQFCDRDARIQERHSELAVLYRLSSLLVGVRKVDAVMDVALGSMIDVLRMDAGVIHRDGEDDAFAAHAGLSEEFVAGANDDADIRDWLNRPLPDAGVEVVKLQADTRPRLTAAGFRGAVSAELQFKGRQFGTIHLFARRHRALRDGELAMLRIITEQIAIAMASADMIRAEREHRRVQRQVELAGAVQRRMLPKRVPELPRLDVGSRYESCFELGGDICDLLELNGNLGIVVGDVVGKGVPAALLMASVRATLRAHASDMYHLDQIMTRVNTALTRDTLDNEFATVFYGVIDPQTRMLTYCNAGHEPPVIIRGRGDALRVETLLSSGLALGITKAARYERMLCKLEPGDILIASSDGVMDALNFDDERFGRKRMHRAITDLLASNPDATAQMIVDQVIWDVRRFAGLREETDDATLVAVRVTG